MVSGNRFTSTIAVLLVALVVCSSAAGTVTAASADAGATAAQADSDDELEPADEIYVTEDGDAVLVYENDGDSEATGHIGLNVTKGIMHVLVRDEVDSNSEVTGNASVVVTPDSMAGDGSFATEQPDNLENLDFDLTAVRNASDASMHASFDATTVSEDEFSTSSSLESASTDGQVRMTADEFETNGSFSATYSEDQDTLEHRSFNLVETGDRYVLDASEEYRVWYYAEEDWQTREDAEETLENQYSGIAEQLDGSAEITIESYEYTNNTEEASYTNDEQDVVDIEYRVVYTDIDDQLGEEVANSISNSEEYDISEDSAEAVGDGVANVDVDRVNFTYDAEGTTGAATWDIEISNYSDLAYAGLDVAEETSEDENVTNQIEQARNNYEAMEASGLEQTVSWEGSVSSPSDDEASFSGSLDYETDNYGAYVTELRDRDSYTEGNVTLTASATTQDGDVVTNMSLTVQQQDLVDQAIDGVLASAETADSEMDGEAQQFLEAFQRSEFQRAQMNVSIDDEEVTFESGASFENMSAFQSALPDDYDGQLAAAYANIGEDERSYLYVSGAFSGEITEDTVREHEAVDDDTEVNLPGDWDPAEEDFPRMNDTEAQNYLGVEAESGATGTATTTASANMTETENGTAAAAGTTVSGPGFTPLVALGALLVAALLFRRKD
jgi:PGF-CTERM protein